MEGREGKGRRSEKRSEKRSERKRRGGGKRSKEEEEEEDCCPGVYILANIETRKGLCNKIEETLELGFAGSIYVVGV